MTCTINRQRQRGFTLIEALFSALILAIALLGLAGFHAVALQDSSLVKARAVAASLAQEKLDDLRSFSRLSDDPTTTTVDECGAGTFCFSEIATNAGGKELTASTTLVLPSGTVSGYIDNYSRAWTVTCSAEAAATAPSFSSTCNSATVVKLVTVTISWTDSKGASQSVDLQGVIYAMDPARAARASLNSSSSQTPKVTYTPIGVPDAVPVPINTGGTYKESSKPLPDVSSKGYSLRTEFDAVTYTTGTPTTKNSQFEFATVSCTCEFAGSGQGYPASYFYWDGGALKVKVPDAMVTKMTGTAPTISGDKQDDLCDTCCRDHHDSEGYSTVSPTTAQYDPDRPSADYTGNNHKHYYFSNPNNPQDGLVEVAESNGSRYLEACRFVRVDGVYRLLQDWRAIDLVVMPYDNYLSTTATLTAYQTYILDMLRYQSRTDCASASGTGCTDISQSSAPAKSSLPTRDLTSQSAGTFNQLLARALYMDRVYGKTAPRTLDATYYTALASQISAYQSDTTVSWLDRVPFNEVNVTLLTSWASSDNTIVTTTNEKIVDISATATNYYGVYSRGKTQIASGASAGSGNVTAYLLPSGSGLTGGTTRDTYTGTVDYDCSSLAQSGTISYASEIGLEPHDHCSANRFHDSINIARAGTVTYNTIGGYVRAGNASGVTAFSSSSVVTLTASPTATCTVSAPVGGVATYSCTVASTYNGTLTASTTLSSGFFDVGSDTTYDTEGTVKGYSGSVATLPENVCDINSGAITASCTNYWLFGPTINILGTCNGNSCNSTNVSVVSNLGGTGADVACTISGTTITCPVTLDTTSKTWAGTFKISNNSGSYYLKADATSCEFNDGTSAKTTSSVSAGPADKQAAFNVCASNVASLPPAPSTPTGVALIQLSSSASSSGTDVKFSWTDVSSETSYTVYKCQANGNSSCVPTTSDTPTNLAANATSTVQALANNKTICMNVIATNSGGSSTASQYMCAYYKSSPAAFSITGPL